MAAASQFRARSTYNNVVYSLAGHVAGRLGGGRSWESLLRELVLDPLNMTQTSFFDARDVPLRFARNYVHRRDDRQLAAWTHPPAMA